MRSMRALCFSMLMISTTCALAQEKSQIQDIENQLAAAIVAGDGKTAASLYAEDAILLPPGVPTVSGRAAIETFWNGRKGTLSELHLTTVDVQPMGTGYAREIGTIAGKTSGSDQKSFTGKYLLIFRKVGDTWQATTDAWSRD
jgi:ketosteroid isomerase-like protein